MAIGMVSQVRKRGRIGVLMEYLGLTVNISDCLVYLLTFVVILLRPRINSRCQLNSANLLFYSVILPVLAVFAVG